MKSHAIKLLFIWLAVALSACSALGLQQAQSPSQGIAYAYGQVAAVRTQAAVALQNGTITVATAQKVLADTDTARGLLDAAQKTLASGGDTSTVAGTLATVNTLLTNLQALLPKVAGNAT